mmetsp:Transcript_28734/g.66704  ORF Transcript_28734/g.66704 Transcript_28734/m.66704 type:complete len:447 (+) Transcript_28734:59-1399(+)
MLCWRAFAVGGAGLLLYVTCFLAAPLALRHDQGRRLKRLHIHPYDKGSEDPSDARDSTALSNKSTDELQFDSGNNDNNTNIIHARRAGALDKVMPEGPYFVEGSDGKVMPDGRLCIRGKAVPTLYVLGEAKSGTCTSYSILHYTGGIDSVGERVPNAEKKSYKEYNWFFRHWHKVDPKWDVDEVAESWYADMPDCNVPHSDAIPARKRFVLGDFTPIYARMTPFPSGYTKGRYFEHLDVNKMDLPRTFRHIYGPFAHHLNFVYLVREPVSQMKSVWYFKTRTDWPGKRTKKDKVWIGAKMGSFPADVTLALDEYAEGRITVLFWAILYGRHLQSWMSHFAASQFMPIPFRYLAYMKRAEVCSMIGKQIGAAITCADGEESQRSVKNNQEHEDLSEDLHARVDAALAPELQLFIDLLHNANQHGAALVGLTPEATKEDVKQWLLVGW